MGNEDQAGRGGLPSQEASAVSNNGEAGLSIAQDSNKPLSLRSEDASKAESSLEPEREAQENSLGRGSEDKP